MQVQDTRPATRLTALYEAHAADVFRFAMHLTGSREDAEDVVQFVFLRAYAALEEGTELMHPRAWLMKAAKHRSLNTIRDRREAPMAESELPLSPRHDPDPSEAAALAAVRSTLWTLPEGQHQAFVLRHWSGLSQDEIADVLDTTPGAVESLLIRARRALVEDQQEAGTECSRVRSRLVQALIPSSAQQAHITSCRRCRTAQSRLLRASEFATAYALVPRPWVAHTLSSAIPGFGSSAAVTTTTAAATGGGSAGVTGGGSAGVTAASAATKAALLAKVTLATATAVVALGATHPVRSALADAIAGRPAPPAHRLATTTHAPAPTAARPLQRAASGAQAAGASGTAPGKSATAGSNGNGEGNGAAHGKSATAGSNGNGAAHGKSATAGSNGNGKSATAGSNGKAGGTGKSATAGGNGKAGGTGKAGTGKSATAGGNGKAGATGKSATAGGNGNGVPAGGSGNAGGHGKGKPTS
jgi:RNA polymerase sigma factor (sigma-70 family)